MLARRPPRHHAQHQAALRVQGAVVPAVSAEVLGGVGCGPRFFFVATKNHFSSNCTSWVEGGKAHPLVVELLGGAAGLAGAADDGVLADPDQAGSLADADALGAVGQDGHGLVGGQAGGEPERACAG